MAKNAGFLLGCLLGTEEGAKALAPHAAAMGLWNLCLQAEGRAAIEEAGEVLPAVVDIVQRGGGAEALTPCIGCLEAMSRSVNEDVKGAIFKTVPTLVARFETHSKAHSRAETAAIYGLLGNLAADRAPRALAIADRMLKPDNLRALRNWVEHDLQAAAVAFMEGLSTVPELHDRLVEYLDVGLAVQVMCSKASKIGAHAALGYLGNLATRGEARYKTEVHDRLTSDGVEGIVRLAKVGPERARCRVAAVMWPIVKEPAAVRVFRAAVPPLVPLLRSEDDATVATVTATLWFMTYDDEVCKAIGAAGGVPALVKHATSKNDKVRMHTTGILRNMSQEESLLAEMAAAGCPAHLLNVWKPVSCPPVTLPTGPDPNSFPAVPLYML